MVFLIFSVQAQDNCNFIWNTNQVESTSKIGNLPYTICLEGFVVDDTINFIEETGKQPIKFTSTVQSIQLVSDNGIIKIKVGNNTYNLALDPNSGSIFKGDKKLTLNFTPLPNQNNASQNSIITLPDIDCRYGDGKNINEKYKHKIGKGNKLLVIDASSDVSAQSGIYKRCKEGLSKCNYLSYRDFVKVYIENLNPYLYDVKVATASTDIGIKPVESDDKGSSLHAAGVDSQPSDPLKMLLNYSNATKYLLRFIECVKTNSKPSSDVLESNKDIIRNALSSAKITPDKNIEEFYTALDTLKQKYKSDYELAKQFSSVYNEFESLSYTIESTLLPIRVKSYDKLSITITLRDLKSKNIVQEQEYEFLIRGGWNIDQSFGIVGHQLTDKIYTLSDSIGLDSIFYTLPNGFETDSISAYTRTVFRKINEESRPGAAFGLSTLTNIYYRLTPGLNIGVGLGVSADIYPNTNVRYLTGGTLIFKDDRNKISLNFGYAWGQYKDFGTGQKDGTILKGANTIPNMIDKYGSSLYIGISYQNQIFNFNNIQKEKKEVN